MPNNNTGNRARLEQFKVLLQGSRATECEKPWLDLWRGDKNPDRKHKEEGMARSSCVSTAVMCLMLILVALPPIACIEDKCAACRAVAVELETGLANEKPGNHLDMRHRLDSRGQREGKLIDYKVSELRVVELLDGLCERMKDYTLNKTSSGKVEWIKVKDWESALFSIDKQEASAYSKDMSTYCGRLLEQTEEELADKIRSGAVNVGDVEEVLCQHLSKHCDSVKSAEMDKSEISEEGSAVDGDL